MAPASRWKTTRWSPSHYGEVAAMILQETPKDILLLGAESDRDLLEVVRSYVPKGLQERIHNMAGQINLRESMLVLKRSVLALVNEGVDLQLAQAAGTPSFVIYGSTSPSRGYGPRGSFDRIFTQDLPCIPCGSEGHLECPLDTLDCLEKTSAREVMDAIHAHLQTRQESQVAQFDPCSDRQGAINDPEQGL